MMDCHEFADRLEAFLEEVLSPGDRREVEQHLDGCDDCRALSGLAEDPDLTGAILARTSGTVCSSARDRLCDYSDGQLETVDSDLVRGHLEGCEPCTALARVLHRMSEDLPRLAELQPGADFVRNVLAQTRPRGPRVVPWAARVAQAWQKVMDRPRFALEGAYIGSAVLVLIFNLPGTHDIPRQALDLIRSNPVRQLAEPVSGFNANIASNVEQAWDKTADKLARGSRGVARFSTTAFGAIRTDLETIWDGITSGQETEDNKSSQPNDDTQGDES